jgi:hypothetical protein
MTKKQKILQRVSKKQGANPSGQSIPEDSLYEQYKIIREDLIKLKEDLSKGYEMARGMMDRKTLMKELMKQ